MSEYTYEILDMPLGGQMLKRVDKIGEVAWIPLEESNSDYIAYLASLDESTVLPETPEPVDESEPTESADEPSLDTE